MVRQTLRDHQAMLRLVAPPHRGHQPRLRSAPRLLWELLQLTTRPGSRLAVEPLLCSVVEAQVVLVVDVPVHRRYCLTSTFSVEATPGQGRCPLLVAKARSLALLPRPRLLEMRRPRRQRQRLMSTPTRVRQVAQFYPSSLSIHRPPRRRSIPSYPMRPQTTT